MIKKKIELKSLFKSTYSEKDFAKKLEQNRRNGML